MMLLGTGPPAVNAVGFSGVTLLICLALSQVIDDRQKYSHQSLMSNLNQPPS